MWTPADFLKGGLFAVAVIANGAIMIQDGKAVDPRYAATRSEPGAAMAASSPPTTGAIRQTPSPRPSLLMRLVSCDEAMPPPRQDT
jgi:hypothetical protein